MKKETSPKFSDRETLSITPRAFTSPVNSGVTVIGETVDGTQIINGGTAIGTTIVSGGVQNVLSGSRVSATTISSGGTQLVSGGTVSMTAVSNGGSQRVNSGCAVTATTVGGGGILEIVAGGTATGATLNAGYVLHADTSATLASGSVTISGGTATNITVNDGGEFDVLAGGAAISTTVNSEGQLGVYTGGTASSTTVNNGGMLGVQSGGTASVATIKGGGILFPEAGARITGITLSGGGSIDLSIFGSTGSFVIDSLTVIDGGGVGLENCDTSIGHSLTINSLSGSAEFYINTDLANGQADTITIKSATNSTANRLQVNYDPVYLTGQSVTGSAIIATVSKGIAGFTPMPTQYGAYCYTPTITVTKPGATIGTLTKLAPVSSPSATVDSPDGDLVGWRSGNNKPIKRMATSRNPDRPKL